MKISATQWAKYTQKLKAINEKAGEAFRRFRANNPEATAQELIDYAKALIDKYAGASSELACEMYELIADMQGVAIESAIASEPATYSEVGKAIVGNINSEENQVSAISRMVKKAAADTLLENARRDGAYYAWIPHGSETCPYCLTLGALGWQKTSSKRKEAYLGHIHAHCQCEFCVDFKGNIEIEGYSPDKLENKLQGYSDNDMVDSDHLLRSTFHNSKQKGMTEDYNAIRRKMYAENKDKINAQKRAAYARRIEAEEQ